MTTPSVKQKQRRAKAKCLSAIKAAFARHGIIELSLSDLRDPDHRLQCFPIAVRNSDTDHNGAVYEHAYEIVWDMYDSIGAPTCTNPETSFQYRVFDLRREGSLDVVAFIDHCDDPDEVVEYVGKWQKRFIH